MAELEELLQHLIRREEIPLREGMHHAVEVTRFAAMRHAKLSAQWLKVGYVQGNMNSDNCLVGGYTMDYGPFGFIEKYDPLWSPFTSDPERKFGFERQPHAAHINLVTLARALAPLLDGNESQMEALQRVVSEEYTVFLQKELGEVLNLALFMKLLFVFAILFAIIFHPLLRKGALTTCIDSPLLL